MAGPSVIQRRPETPGPEKQSLVYPGLKIPFILLVTCFAAWGSAANLTDVLVGVFRHIFDMSNFQSALVQFAYYGAYFSLAIPAALINKRYGYKAGVLTGLGLATVGGLLFIPASFMLAYGAFLVALFVLAAGLSILETSANPFVIAMGPGGQRHPATEPRAGVQPGRGEHRGPARCRADPAPDHARAGEGVDDGGPVGAGSGGGPVAGARAVHRDRPRAPGDLDLHRRPQDRRPGRARRVRAARTGGTQGRGHGPPVAQRPLPLRRGRPVPQRRRPGLRVDVHHPVRAGRGGCAHRAVGVVPAGQPDRVPPRPVPDDLPAGHLPADEAPVRHGCARRRALAHGRVLRRTWSD